MTHQHFGTYTGHERIPLSDLNNAGEKLWQVENYQTGKVHGTIRARTSEGAIQGVLGRLPEAETRQPGRLVACLVNY